MCPYDKPAHEICIDKTSCQSEARNRNGKGGRSVATHGLTKDAIRKAYMQNEPRE